MNKQHLRGWPSNFNEPAPRPYLVTRLCFSAKLKGFQYASTWGTSHTLDSWDGATLITFGNFHELESLTELFS